jgi:hypothetical protein
MICSLWPTQFGPPFLFEGRQLLLLFWVENSIQDDSK